jgi:hypothetical protein
MKSLEPKDAAEKYAVEFQFDRVLAAITSASCTVELLAGTDAAPDDLLDGAAQISGTSVYQRVKAGVSGCTYKLRCTAANSGAGDETYVLTASLGVVTA